MNSILSQMIVICIGLAISAIGIYYHQLAVPNLYISCATVAALFFTIIDFIEAFFNKRTIEDLQGTNKVVNWIVKKIYNSKRSIILFCLVAAIFSIIFFPFVPQIEKLLNGLNDQLSIFSLGLVIFILGLKHLDLERDSLEEASSVLKDYRAISEKSIKVIEKSRDDYEKLAKSYKLLHEENEVLKTKLESLESKE